jgi:hypothetical protein
MNGLLDMVAVLIVGVGVSSSCTCERSRDRPSVGGETAHAGTGNSPGSADSRPNPILTILESLLRQPRRNDPWAVTDEDLVLDVPDVEMPATRSYLAFLSMHLERCVKRISAARSYVLTLNPDNGQYTVVASDGTELDDHVLSCMPKGIVVGELTGANVVEIEVKPARPAQDPAPE